MAAAPHLFDDPPITSPELALVDAELAAELRADLSSGGAFRPREVARPAYLSLVFDAGAPEPAPQDEPPIDEHEELPVDVVHVGPAYVVLADDENTDLVVGDFVTDVAESVAEPVLPAAYEPAEDLPDYIVGHNEAIVDAAPEHVPSTDEAVVDDDVAGYVPESIVLPVLPAPDEPADEHELPDYIVREAVVEAVPEYVVVADDHGADDDVIPGIVADASPNSTQASSDYPVLPDLDERSEAIEETEAALRKIREQMGGGASTSRRRRFRRRFTVATGVCAGTALAVYVAEVELGVTHAPGWLSF